MDGACKAVLKLLSEEMPKLFPQRCSTHGCNLLMQDIGKCFDWEISWCLRLIVFICNHDAIFAVLQSDNDAKNLLGVCDVRFASQLYSVDRIVDDKQALERLFVSQSLLTVLDRPSSTKEALKAEHQALKTGFIQCDETWKRIEVFRAIETPIRVLLRITDSHEPSLCVVKSLFDEAHRVSRY
jgi:hypothetical protein